MNPNLENCAMPRRTLRARLSHPYKVAVSAGELWLNAEGLRMSAAMSFYGVLSLAPLLLVLVALLGWWVDKTTLQSNLVAQVQAVVGAQAASLVQQALTSAQAPAEGMLASLLALGVLLMGATGVFAELQASFDAVWKIGLTTPAVTPWWHAASLRLRGVAYILAFGFLLLVSLVISAALEVLTGWVGAYLPLAPVLGLVNEAVSFVFCAGLFLALMRMSTGTKPRLRCLAWGALAGAALFTLGKHGLAFYLSTAPLVSVYGAAGSLVVVLVWIYFSSAVLLFSAALARALSLDWDERATAAKLSASGELG